MLESPLTTAAFRAYVAQFLVPTLPPGALVLLDNLAVPKDPLRAQDIDPAGAQLMFQPPYSPDLNRIEPGCAKLKALARGRPPPGRARRCGPLAARPCATSPRWNVNTTSITAATW